MITTAIILWILLAGTAAFWVYASLIEPQRLCVRQIDVPLPDLPEALVGLRIAHLSDLHCACRHHDPVTRRAITETLQQAPDLVMITGDLSNGSRYADCIAEHLGELSARYGVYAVLGNHDWNCTLETYLFGSRDPDPIVQDWEQALSQTEIQLLENKSCLLTLKGQTVAIVGVGDPSCGRDDIEAALEGIGPADLKIMLAHSPDAIDLPGADWADLLLAGHTHGGQCRLPGLGSPWAPVWRLRQRSSGLMRSDQTLAYVSRGIGAGMEARFLCPPEVCILTLRQCAAEQIPSVELRNRANIKLGEYQ
ncbi:MAG: metallophosphoesterase [Armatimonadetes bacterium]|nr:metallophosphoesterase [Armatimonadota bacterium]